jgi:tetratricopeptide (TPR) repeat protein
MKRRLWIIVALVAVAAIAIAAPLAWKAHVQADFVRSSMPPRPNLSRFPSELFDRVVAAETKTRKEGSIPALEELAVLYQANGFLAEADQCGQALMRVQPRNAKWPHRLATIRAGYGELDTAILLWERTVRLADYVPAMIRLGDAYLKSNRDADAKRAYEAVLKRDEGNPYALVGLARIDLKSGDRPSARARLEAAMEHSKSAIGSDLLVTVYEQMGENERAAAMRAQTKASGTYYDPPDEWIDSLIDDCYDGFRVAVAAGFAEHRADVETARRILDRAVQLSPRDAHIQLQMGMLCNRAGDPAAARQYLEKAAELDPTVSDAWAQLVVLYAAQGDRTASARALAQGLAHCPTSPGLHLERGRRLLAAGQIDGAIAEFRETFRLRPEEGDPLIEIAKIYLQQNRTDEAMIELRRALAAEPEQPLALMTLALYTIGTGNEKDASDWVRRCHLQYRVPPEALARIDAQFAQRFGHPFVADRNSTSPR